MPPVAGLGQRDVANVVFEIDLGLVHPVGTVQIERHPNQAAAKNRRDIEPLADVRHDVAQPDPAAGRRTRIVDPEHRHVHALVGALHGKEEFV